MQAVLDSPAPQLRPELRLLLGVAGNYWEFCINLADVTAPLTTLAIPEESSVWLIKLILLLVTLQLLEANKADFFLCCDDDDDYVFFNFFLF